MIIFIMSSSININIIAFIFGALIIISFFLFFRLVVFLKRGFTKVFKNFDTIYNKVNNILDNSKKYK